MTPPEIRLWQRLRGRGTGLPVFRRQHPMGPYVIDFYCPAARLAVEVDGIGHSMGDQPQRDERRDDWLLSRGIVTLRVPAGDVMRRFEDSLQAIITEALARIAGDAPPPPSLRDGPPPPLRGGG